MTEPTLDYSRLTARAAGRSVQRFAALPEWPFAIAAVGLLALSCYAASLPDGSFELAALSMVGWLSICVAWLLRLAEWFGSRSWLRPHVPKWRRLTVAVHRAATVPLLCVTAAVLVANDVPFAAAFRLSRPALESQARALLGGGPTAASTAVIPSRWYGDCAVTVDERGVSFWPHHADGQLVYSPAGVPSGLGEYRPMSGSWYVWRNTN